MGTKRRNFYAVFNHMALTSSEHKQFETEKVKYTTDVKIADSQRYEYEIPPAVRLAQYVIRDAAFRATGNTDNGGRREAPKPWSESGQFFVDRDYEGWALIAGYDLKSMERIRDYILQLREEIAA